MTFVSLSSESILLVAYLVSDGAWIVRHVWFREPGVLPDGTDPTVQWQLLNAVQQPVAQAESTPLKNIKQVGLWFHHTRVAASGQQARKNVLGRGTGERGVLAKGEKRKGRLGRSKTRRAGGEGGGTKKQSKGTRP